MVSRVLKHLKSYAERLVSVDSNIFCYYIYLYIHMTRQFKFLDLYGICNWWFTLLVQSILVASSMYRNHIFNSQETTQALGHPAAKKNEAYALRQEFATKVLIY